MKKLIAIGAVALSLAGCGASTSMDRAQAAAQLKLEVDGQAVLTTLHPFYSDDILYVPARVLMEYYPCELKWNNTLKTLTFSDGISSYVLQPGSEYMQAAENYKDTLEGPAILRSGHVYIPTGSLNTLSGADAKLNASNTSVAVVSGSVSTTVRTPREPLALAEGNNKVKLYAALKDGDTYKGYILEVEGKKHSFNWQGPRLPLNPPQLYYTDIDKDRQPEAVIVLTLGTGTGVVAQEIHVVKPQQWKEISVPAAEKAASSLLSSSIAKDNNDLLINIQLKGSVPASLSLRLPGRANDGAYNKSLVVGAVTYYGVESGRLKAETNAAVGMVESIGNFELFYKTGSGGLEPDSIRFVPYPEYAAYVQKSK
jgi:hypothetical protein